MDQVLITNKNFSAGENLKRLRKLKNLTQKEVASAIGVHDSAVSQWERGKLDIANGQLSALAKVLSVTEEEITSRLSPQVIDLHLNINIVCSGCGVKEVTDEEE